MTNRRRLPELRDDAAMERFYLNHNPLATRLEIASFLLGVHEARAEIMSWMIARNPAPEKPS